MAGGERNAHIFCLIRHCAGREEERGEGGGRETFLLCSTGAERKKNTLRKNNYNILPFIPNPKNCVVQLTTATKKCADKS